MSEDEINKAVKEAAEFEAQDKKKKEAIDARNDADSFVFQTENALSEVGSSISDGDKAEVQADLDALKKLLEAHPDAAQMTDAEVDEMKAAKEKLMGSAQKVFQKMYEQQAQNAQGAAGQGAAGSDTGAGAQPGGDDDVVDADYKEV